jgi:hypothetical protein
MGMAPPPSRSDNNAQRRSQRVMLKVSVVILAHGADNKVVSEATRTVTVNAHGASVMLGLKVSVGQILMLRNSGTGRKCRVEWYISVLIKQRSEKWESIF